MGSEPPGVGSGDGNDFHPRGRIRWKSESGGIWVGSGLDRVGSWDDELLFFSKFFKVVEDIPGNIPREYYATAPRWKFRNIFVNVQT